METNTLPPHLSHVYTLPYLKVTQTTSDISQNCDNNSLYSTGVVWHNGSMLLLINEVNLHWAQLALQRVTVSGFNSRCGTFISVCNESPGSTQPGHPFVGRCNEYWGVEAGVVRVWVARKTVRFPCHTWAISKCFRDGQYKALYKFTFFTLHYFKQWVWTSCSHMCLVTGSGLTAMMVYSYKGNTRSGEKYLQSKKVSK